MAKLRETIETKGLKNLNNVKTHWICMLSPFKWMLQEYHPLLLKMTLDNPTIQAITSNLEHLADVETFLNLVLHCPSFM